MAVPVHIVAGFLGSGKTTLIRGQLAARRGERVAIIVNDFGEASLDEATLSADEPFRITSIPGGCVCCTAPEGFVGALGAVLEQAPDRLIIEPTGLARPQDLVDTIRRCHHRDALELAPVVVLVDPARLAGAGEAERELVELQAGVADVLVANRTDLCDASALERFDAFAEALWPAPLAVHRTSHGRLPPEILEWPAGEGPRLPRSAQGEPAAGHDHGAHASTSGYTAWSWRWPPDAVFASERLERAAMRMQQGLAGAPLARLKGIFRTREGYRLLEVAGGQLHAAPSAHRRDSRLDVIFEGDDAELAKRVADWLRGAELTEKELAAGRHQIELALPDGRVRVLRREELAALPGGVDDVSTLFPKRSGAAARVGALLDRLELPSEGSAVVCAADGFASEPVPLSALREGVLLHSLEGAPLPDAQGGPFRLLIPEGVPGAPSACANVKAVTRIVVRDG